MICHEKTEVIMHYLTLAGGFMKLVSLGFEANNQSKTQSLFEPHHEKTCL